MDPTWNCQVLPQLASNCKFLPAIASSCQAHVVHGAGNPWHVDLPGTAGTQATAYRKPTRAGAVADKHHISARGDLRTADRHRHEWRKDKEEEGSEDACASHRAGSASASRTRRHRGWRVRPNGESPVTNGLCRQIH